MFGSLKLAKNADPDKCKYRLRHRIRLRSEFSLPDVSMGKNVIIFGADMNSSVHIDNKKKDISVLGGGPRQGLGDTTLIAEA